MLFVQIAVGAINRILGAVCPKRQPTLEIFNFIERFSITPLIKHILTEGYMFLLTISNHVSIVTQ